MASKAFDNEFLKNLELLNRDQQNKVIAYVRKLLKSTTDNHQALLLFAGAIKPDDAQEMTAAIKAGCENIDSNEW
jgi:hypothetical protein